MVEYNFFLLKPDGVSDMIREEISEKCGHKLIRVDNEESIELSEKQIDALYPKYNEVHRPFTVNMLREAYSSVFKYAPHYPVTDHPRKHRKTRPVVYL